MVFATFVSLLAILMVISWRSQRALERRIQEQQNLPRERLVPRHYLEFTEVEHRLWEAVQSYRRSTSWEETRFRRRGPAFDIVEEYVRGLQEDFKRGHRIFGQIILHAPEMELFARLEWERVKIEIAYYRSCAVLWFRLKTAGVSILELRQLTDVVATLAYRVRTMLTALDTAGNMEFVDALLRRS
jgi:hypothetical protein